MRQIKELGLATFVSNNTFLAGANDLTSCFFVVDGHYLFRCHPQSAQKPDE